MERPGDWQCPNVQCVNHSRMVFGSKANCPKCGTGRDDPQPAEIPTQIPGGQWYTGVTAGVSPAVVIDQSKPEKGMQGGDMPDDWQCPNQGCINHTKMVFGKRSSCPSCGTARNAKQPGDWQCPNSQCLNHRNTVFASKMSCPKCGSPRPGAFPSSTPQLATDPGTNAAAQVNNLNPLGALGAQLPFNINIPLLRPDVTSSNGSGGGGMTGSPGDWRCPNVSCINNRKMVFAKNSMCPKCGSPKESAAPQSCGDMGMGCPVGHACGAAHGGGNPGDWQCPNSDCLNHRNKVFAKHAMCPNCGMEKPEGARTRSRSPYRMS